MAGTTAFSLAQEIAGRIDAKIQLLHVRVVLDDPNVDAGILNEVEQILTASEPRIRQALEEARENRSARIGIVVRWSP